MNMSQADSHLCSLAVLLFVVPQTKPQLGNRLFDDYKSGTTICFLAL